MLSIVIKYFHVVNYVAAWLVTMHDYLFLCTHLNLQEDSYTDGSGQKDQLSSPSSQTSDSSCGSDKPLLSSPGMSSSSPDLLHFTGCCVNMCMGQFVVVVSQRSCVGSLYYNKYYTDGCTASYVHHMHCSSWCIRVYLLQASIRVSVGYATSAVVVMCTIISTTIKKQTVVLLPMFKLLECFYYRLVLECQLAMQHLLLL